VEAEDFGMIWLIGLGEGDRRPHLFIWRSDQRWQKVGGATAKIGGVHRRQGLSSDGIVKHHPTAAIQLQVNEAGSHRRALDRTLLTV
jgi:hypothetical protein